MKLSNEQGFTLIEMMVSLVLISVIGMAIYGIFSYASGYLTTGEVITSLHRKAYAAMDTMTMVLREGDTIEIPSLIYSDIATDSIDTTNQDGDTVSFYTDDGDTTLFRNNNDGGGNIVLLDGGEYLTDVEFTDNDPAVTINMSVRLVDTTIRGTGRGNIVLVRDDAGECGESCVELYTDVVNRNRLIGP